MPSASASEESSDASSNATAPTVDTPIEWAFLPDDAVAVTRLLERDAECGPSARTGRVFDLWPSRSHQTATWTFGLEFEFACADAGWVAAELFALGMVASPYPVAYHAPREAGMWSVEHDSTVTTVFHDGDSSNAIPSVAVGGEVVSPPLRDCPETWAQIAAVLSVLSDCGAEVNSQTGLHVHFGADALRDLADAVAPEHEVERRFVRRVTRLAVLANACFEDVLFRMASAEGGRHRGRPFFYRHSRPLEQVLRREYDTVEALAQTLGKPGAARRAALNLTNIGSADKDTVEFRQSNGTLDMRVVQAFVRLCALLVGAARWIPESVQPDPQPLGFHLADSDGGQLLADDAPLWRMLRATCPDGLPTDAAASLLWLFRRGSWQPGLADLARGS
jgi:hypothetical protein